MLNAILEWVAALVVSVVVGFGFVWGFLWLWSAT